MPEGEVIRRGWFCCHFPAKWGVPTWFSLTPRVGKRIRDPSCAVTGVGIQVPQQASTAWPSAEEAAYYFSPLDSVDSVRWGLLAVWELPPDYQLGFGVEAPHVTFNDNTGEEPFCCPSGVRVLTPYSAFSDTTVVGGGHRYSWASVDGELLT